jgi:hypothetical protein
MHAQGRWCATPEPCTPRRPVGMGIHLYLYAQCRWCAAGSRMPPVQLVVRPPPRPASCSASFDSASPPTTNPARTVCTNGLEKGSRAGWMGHEEGERYREADRGGGRPAAAAAAPSDIAGRADAARAVAAGHADAQSASASVRLRHPSDVGSEHAEEELERIRLRFSISLHTAVRADVRQALQVRRARIPPPVPCACFPTSRARSGETQSHFAPTCTGV